MTNHATMHLPSTLLGLLLVSVLLGFTLLSAQAQVSVTIGPGAAVAGETGTLEVSGDWDTQGTFDPGTGTVVFTGTQDQTIAGMSAFHGLGIDKSGGHLIPNADLTVTNTVKLLDGTLDNNAHGLALGDSVTVVRATGDFAAPPTFEGAVHLTYTGTTPVTTGNELPIGAPSIVDVTIQNTGGVTLSAPVTVARTLTLAEGVLNNTVHEVTVADGATVAVSEGTLADPPIYAGAVDITYRGDTPITTGIELPEAVDHLTVDNPAGVTLHQDVTVHDRLRLLAGNLDLNGWIVTLSPTALLVESPGHTVTGSAGFLTTVRTLNAPQGVDAAGLGVTLTSDADLGPTTIRRGHAVHPLDDLSSIQRYYDIEPSNNDGLDATLTLAYDPSELGEGAESNLVLYRSTDGGSTWSLEGGTVNPETHTIRLDHVDAFSRWTMGTTDDDPVPVELVGFTAALDREAVLLAWQTASETHNAGFEVQTRSTMRETEHAGTWKVLNFVEGAGTTVEPQSYTYRVERLDPGAHVFRLRQLDADGTHAFSPEVEVTVALTRPLVVEPAYPNPLVTAATFRFGVREAQQVRVELFDVLGRRVATLYDGTPTAHRMQSVTVDGTRLASGLYFLRVITERGGRALAKIAVVR